MMKKLTLVLAAATVLGTASPASAQFFFGVGDPGFSVGFGAPGPYYHRHAGWWGEPYAYGGPWGYRRAGWWGEPFSYHGPFSGYRSVGFWGGPAFGYAPGYTAYAAAPGYIRCRTVRTRHVTPSGRIVIRRMRTC
jgi:hypothetical protein